MTTSSWILRSFVDTSIRRSKTNPQNPQVYQLKYDSVHKRFPGTIDTKTDGGKEYLVVNGKPIRVFHEKDPGSIGWGDAGADYVCESTGVFLESAKAEAHIGGGCKKVIMSAPPKVRR